MTIINNAIYPILGIAFNNALTNILSSGTIDTSLRALKTLNNIASNIPEPPAGIRLPMTITVSNIFQPLVKNFLKLLVANYRITISMAKNTVIPTSINTKT